MLGPDAQRISTGFDPLISFLMVFSDSKKLENPHIHKRNSFGLGKSSYTKKIGTNTPMPVKETANLNNNRYTQMKKKLKPLQIFQRSNTVEIKDQEIEYGASH